MGNVDNVNYKDFPRQSAQVGKQVDVCFYYQADNRVFGELVRDDREAPWETIIKLDDGRYIMGEECQWTVP
jgi:hypothetical protein